MPDTGLGRVAWPWPDDALEGCWWSLLSVGAGSWETIPTAGFFSCFPARCGRFSLRGQAIHSSVALGRSYSAVLGSHDLDTSMKECGRDPVKPYAHRQEALLLAPQVPTAVKGAGPFLPGEYMAKPQPFTERLHFVITDLGNP